MRNEHLVQFAVALAGYEGEYSMSLQFSGEDDSYVVTHNGDLFYPWNLFKQIPRGVEPVGDPQRSAADVLEQIAELEGAKFEDLT